MFKGLTILTLIIVSVTRLCVGYNEFEYTMCSWKKSKCEQVDRNHFIDDKNKTSRLPNGPFALLSPIDGCPEPSAFGWRRGYIAFTWKQPHIVVTERGCGLYTSKEKCNETLLPEIWPYIESFMSGPFSKYAFRLNFCFKTNKVDVNSDEAQWPNGKYTIFRDSSGCPSGFQSSNLTIRLPPIHSWKSDGKLPDFEVKFDEDGHVRLVLRTCIHEEEQEGDLDFTDDDEELKLESYVLIVTNTSECPSITYKQITREILKLSKDVADEQEEIEIFTFCHYRPIEIADFRQKQFDKIDLSYIDYRCAKGYGFFRPDRYSLDIHDIDWNCVHILWKSHKLDWFRNEEQRRRNKYRTYFVVADSTMTFGNTTVSKDLMQKEITDGIPQRNPIMIMPWLLVDLGRNMIVTGLQIKQFYSRYARENNPIFRCFIGDDRWMITQFGADLCFFEIPELKFRVGTDLMCFFRKHHNGRFIKLVGHLDKPAEYFNKILADIEVITTEKLTYDDTICNEDLGMADWTIKDSQIQDAYSSRPFQCGLCLGSDSRTPYLTVNLGGGTHVDGITLFNMQRVKEEVLDSKFQRQFVPAGSKRILLSLFIIFPNETHAQHNQTFSIDEYLPIERPQTFFFDVPGKVKTIEIYILQPFKETCFRFELHGCRGPDLDKASFPALYREDSGSTVYNLQTINATSVNKSIRSSIGFHGTYPAGSSFTDGQFAGLLFTKITHNVFNEGSCSDTFRFLHDGKNGRRILDGLWKPITSVVINTAESYLTLTLSTCTPNHKIERVNQGFKAIVRAADIPTCFSTKDWFQNVCEKPMMIISSYSQLSLQDASVPEKWNIFVPRCSIHLHTIYFNIRCDTGSSLQIKEKFSKGKSFCNLRTVQPEMDFDSEYVNITFTKGDTSKSRHARSSATEWFKAKYTAKPMTHTMVFETNGENACLSRFGKCYYIHSRKPLSWNVAGYECWIRGTRLVTIHSEEEHELIKYMLRNSSFFNVETDEISNKAFVSRKVDPNYYTHIGISRVTTTTGKQVHIWEDGSPVTFSAWKDKVLYLLEDCTRMSFYLFNTNNTWESESCSSGLARFFVCEREIADGLRAMPGEETRQYVGKLSTTKSGRTCQRWDSKYPHGHSYRNSSDYPDASIKDASNYCRDIDNKGQLWCFTTDRYKRWDYCNLLDTAPDRCFSTVHKYTGLWNITKSNQSCQNWNSQTPHEHEQFLDSQFPDNSVEEASNYCRDPYNEGFLWCFTTDPALRSEQCVFNYTYGNHDTKSLFSESNGTFHCGNGDNISSGMVCDGIPNCLNAKDETNCTDEVHPLLKGVTYSTENNSHVGTAYSMFQCRQSEEWISLLSRCDGVIDCVDASDEINCSSTLNCSSNEYECDSGECIHISQMCDFIEDCLDASDEICDYPLCSHLEFRCQNQQCIRNESRCDGFENCLDGSDEDRCDSCRNNTFHCDSKKCIPRRLVCDSYPDCQDQSDEHKCKSPLFSSCEEWWSNGYRNSGVYTLNNSFVNREDSAEDDKIDVKCNFDSVPERGIIISTVFYNFEVTRTIDRNVDVIHSTSNTTIKCLETKFFRNDNYSCEQTIKQTCTPDFIEAFESDDPSSRDAFKECGDCAILKVNISENESKVYSCDSRKPLDESNITLYFTYKQSEDYTRTVTLSSNVFNETMRLEFGPVICKYNEVIGVKEFSCDDGHVFPLSVRCVYDTDPAGFILGCRSGKHLQGCESFSCPEYTTKCPGSFCIPMRFLCDGQIHCPGGHDEENCGCDSNQLEVILLHKEGIAKKDIFFDIGRQFYSKSSVVRELIYREKKMPGKLGNEQILLDITDTEINPFSVTNREYTCNYTILASAFVKTIKFTQAGARGMIFFESSHTEVLSKVFANMKANPGFLMYKIQQNPSPSRNTLKDAAGLFVRNVAVHRWPTLATLGTKYFPNLCKESTKMYCPNQYKCATSKTCIPLHQVCDGFAQCKYGDDERYCSYTCPENCSCSEYSTDCSERGIEVSIVSSLDNKSRSIDLSRNPGLQMSLSSTELNSTKWLFPYLILLNLSNCNIQELKPKIFQRLVNLRILDLSFNRFKQMPGHAFVGLHRLKNLSLHGNKNTLDFKHNSFSGLNEMRNLEIRNTTIGTISAETFSGLELESLKFTDNSIIEIRDYAFKDLKAKELIMERNKVSGFGKHLFLGVSGLSRLYTPEFRFCCVKPNYLLEKDCFPKRDEFSSCDDLIRHPALQMMLWFIGIIALLGNILSIVYRILYDRQRLKFGYGIFVTNLAVADFFMGIYLLIIAIADALYKKRFIFEDAAWRSSTWCTVAGLLSTISSEAGVFFLCLITIDRLLVIKFPFGQVRFDSKKSCIACGVSWMVSILIGVIPIIDYSHFQNRFYSKSGVCIALPLTRDRPPGWLYSVIVFIGLNFVTFCLIALGQIAIYIEMKKSTSGINQSKRSHGKQGASRRMEMTVARNLFFIVATDFLCWFPIGCMGIMSIMGHKIPGDVYAWTAVFVLPVNSALNPVLYTLTAIIGKKQKKPTKLSPVYITAKKVRPFNGMFRYFMTYNSQDCFLSLNDLKKGTIPLTPTDAAKITLNLTRCLCVLHKNSLVVKKLNEHVVYISVARGKVIGEVQLRQEPVFCNSKDEKADDMYQLALIIRSLLQRKRQIT